MKISLVACSALALVTMAGAVASAHIRIDSPTPRWTQNPKPSPCGAANLTNAQPRGPRHTFQAGETITLEWTETTNHPGFYRIAFSEEGDQFTNPEDQADKTMYPGVLVQDIADKAGGSYTQDVELPNVNCDNCTLQLIQVMTEAAKAPTGANPTNHLYFACVDLQLEGAPDGEGGAGGAGGAPEPGDTGGATGTGGASATGGSKATGGTSNGTGAQPSTSTGGGSTTPPVATSQGGCGVVSTRSADATTLALLGLALALFRRRRRSS